MGNVSYLEIHLWLMTYTFIGDIADFLIEEVRKRSKLRLYLTVFSTLIFLVSVTLLNIFHSPQVLNPSVRVIAQPVSILSGLLVLLLLVSFTPARFRGNDDTRLELQTIRQERKELRQRVAGKPRADVFDTIQLSLNQLTEYYAINKSQARNSFRFSVFSIIVGLATLIAGIWLFYLSSTPNIQLTAISSISGLLIEFIGGAYFYLYRKSLDQLNYFFEQLIRMQDIMLSIKLCEDFPDPARQAELKEKIIVTLIEKGRRVFSANSDVLAKTNN